MSISEKALATVHPLKQRSKPMESEAALPNGRTPEQWAEIIRGKWQDNVKSIFETALYIETAHEELGYALWLKKLIQEELRWSRSMGLKILKIAQDENNNFEEVSHVNLPPSWGTLYELTRLTPEQFAKGIESGIIHAGMERKDIRELKPPKEKPKPPPEPELHGQELIERATLEARKIIVSAMAKMTEQEQDDLIALMEFQIADLKSKKKAA